MSDIVERLREGRDGVLGDMLMDEAADEIERLRADLNVALEMIAVERFRSENATADNERLLAELREEGR